MTDLRIQCLCVDTADPAELADFWEAALGWRRTHEEPDEDVLEPPQGSPEDGVVPDLLFLRVPERKAGKNRLHLDLRPLDQAAEVARLEGLGARRTDIGHSPTSAGWSWPTPTATSSACCVRCLPRREALDEGGFVPRVRRPERAALRGRRAAQSGAGQVLVQVAGTSFNPVDREPLLGILLLRYALSAAAVAIQPSRAVV